MSDPAFPPSSPDVEDAVVPPRRRRRSWKALLKAGISTALLVWIVTRADLGDVAAALARTNVWWLVAALLLQLCGSYLTAYRWRRLLHAHQVDIPQGLLFQSCMVSTFYRQFLPSTVGGDAIRMYDSWRAGASKGAAATALVIDRLLGLLMLVLFAVVALPFANQLTAQYPPLYAWVWLGAGGLLVSTWLIFMPSGGVIGMVRPLVRVLPRGVVGLVEKAASAMAAYRGQKRTLIQALFLSLLLQVNVVTFYFCIAQGLGLEVPYHVFYAIVPIAITVMLLPVSINGIGIREGIFVFLLAAYGVGQAEALAFAWLEYGMFLFYGVVGGVVYALRNEAVGVGQRARGA